MFDMFLLWHWLKREKEEAVLSTRRRALSDGRIEGAAENEKEWVTLYNNKMLQAKYERKCFTEPPPHLKPVKPVKRAKVVRYK